MSWTLIEHQALTSSVASVTLGSGGTIPQTYKTLKLVMSVRTDRATYTSTLLYATFNGSNTSYTNRYLEGDGAAASSANAGTAGIYGFRAVGPAATSNTFANIEITIPNYTGSTNKPVSVDGVTENNATAAFQNLEAGLWSNAAAITSITLTEPNGGSNFVSGSTFTLYGLA